MSLAFAVLASIFVLVVVTIVGVIVKNHGDGGSNPNSKNGPDDVTKWIKGAGE